MNNADMPAMPSPESIDTKMSREEFDNKTAGGRFLPNYGLTKREYFAVMAMQGISICGDTASNIAKQSVELADELLVELDK